jgi:hypothetical protein
MASNPIVWVDDDLDYMLLARRALRNNGVSNPIVCLQSHELARSYLRCFDGNEGSDDLPCLMVVEMRAAIEETIRLLSWIRARPAFDEVPLLLLDARFAGDVQQARELGVTEVLSKVVERDAVEALVSHIIRQWL